MLLPSSSCLLPSCYGFFPLPHLTSTCRFNSIITKTFAMNADMILKADLIDLVFEHRNKDYGAYALRKDYRKHLLIGISGPVLVLLLSWWIVNLRDLRNYQITKVSVVGDTTEHIIQPPPKEPAVLPVAAKRVSANQEFFVPVIVEHVDSTEVPAADDLLKEGVVIGTKTDDPVGPPAAPPVAEPPVIATPPAAPEILTEAEVMPAFPGGPEAFSRFMSKHLRVPEELNEPGTRVRIQVNFVVGRDGQLDAIRFADSVNDACQREIRRVFGKMPSWNPGSQHGKSVSVYYHVPIIFEIPEE